MGLRLFAFAVLIVSCHCFPSHNCNLEQCPPVPSNCKAGVTKDSDKCCPVCAKTEGEECGGTWDAYGLCGVDLVCQTNGQPQNDYDLPIGVCVPARRFSARSILKRMLQRQY